MTAPHERARDLIARLCPTARKVFVGRLGTVTVTFRGEGAARQALHKLAPCLAPGASVVPGFDAGTTTPIANARRRDVPVWRVHGRLSA